jgi:hypothetical protein
MVIIPSNLERTWAVVTCRKSVLPIASAYPFGAARWIEPANIPNWSSQVPPEWHGWLTSMNDATPDMEEEYNGRDSTIRGESVDSETQPRNLRNPISTPQHAPVQIHRVGARN